MKLTYFKGSPPNFGDELNPFLWDRLLPAGFLDEDESELFLGIGSIIWDYLPTHPKKIVMGSGYGGYTAPPDIRDGSWDVIFVRGPRTAAMLNLAPKYSICDAAILVRELQLPEPKSTGISFMPHFASINRGFWKEVCSIAGLHFIDPRDPVEKVISEIRGARLLISEAMHGAIVADALRTPWIAARPIDAIHRDKWLDWSEALDLKLTPQKLIPSSMLEVYVHLTKGRRYYGAEGRAAKCNASRIVRPLNYAIIHAAARSLEKLAGLEPQLSQDHKIASLTEQALDAVSTFVRARGRA